MAVPNNKAPAYVTHADNAAPDVRSWIEKELILSFPSPNGSYCLRSATVESYNQ